jgi:hypothetical protein
LDPASRAWGICLAHGPYSATLGESTASQQKRREMEAELYEGDLVLWQNSRGSEEWQEWPQFGPDTLPAEEEESRVGLGRRE